MPANCDVRFTLNSGHSLRQSKCLLWANKRHCHGDCQHMSATCNGVCPSGVALRAVSEFAIEFEEHRPVVRKSERLALHGGHGGGRGVSPPGRGTRCLYLGLDHTPGAAAGYP
jgi:hypothetical protein